MNILIKEKECTYNSDFPAGWKTQSGDYFKFPVTIKADPPFEGEYACFIKRFEKKNPASISGWELLVKLEHKFEPTLARVYDIASVEENHRRVYYVVYEYLEGSTLEQLVANGGPVDLTKLTSDLFLALDSLQKYGYWFSDFVEKNIFAQSNGKYVLMDLDSAQPANRLPHDDMDVSKEYWALVFDYYKKILHYENLKVADLPGLSLNYLQVVFLILRLKLSYDPVSNEYRQAETFHALPAELDRIDPAFSAVFTQIYQERNNPSYATQAAELKRLIIEKIIPLQPVIAAPSRSTLPVIEEFSAHPAMVEKGGSFDLKWKVRNATSIELYKNGVFEERFSPLEKGITKTVFFDGKARTIVYKLVVSAEGKQVESGPVDVQVVAAVQNKLPNPPGPPPISKPMPKTQPVSISQPDQASLLELDPVVMEKPIEELVKDKESVTPLPPPPPPRYEGYNAIIKKYIKSISIGLAVLLALAVLLLIKWWPNRASEEPVVTSVTPRVDMFSPVVINGRNFPTDSGTISVFINKIKVSIQSQADNKLAVDYPKDLDQSHQQEVNRAEIIVDTVDVVINKDTLQSTLRVLRHLTYPQQPAGEAQEEPGPETRPADPPPVTATGTLTSREQRLVDSIGLVRSLRKIREKAGVTDPNKGSKESVEQRILDSIKTVSSQRKG
ncbi:MAG: hypothetical protein INR73_03440 [Williamsia sp.]|nr:hypothetical protein [Williamsia sp.]